MYRKSLTRSLIIGSLLAMSVSPVANAAFPEGLLSLNSVNVRDWSTGTVQRFRDCGIEDVNRRRRPDGFDAFLYVTCFSSKPDTTFDNTRRLNRVQRSITNLFEEVGVENETNNFFYSFCLKTVDVTKLKYINSTGEYYNFRYIRIDCNYNTRTGPPPATPSEP